MGMYRRIWVEVDEFLNWGFVGIFKVGEGVVVGFVNKGGVFYDIGWGFVSKYGILY